LALPLTFDLAEDHGAAHSGEFRVLPRRDILRIGCAFFD
jgi:hypothetical protein